MKGTAWGTDRDALNRRHRTIAAWCGVLVVGMLGAAYASVPLYRLFCQVTGFAGTPQRAASAPAAVLDKVVTIRFDANTSPGLPWRFEPVQRTLKVHLGENALAFYRATNLSDQPVKGMASFNVTPETAGGFFNKIECFCFTEQVLEPGQSVEMPVSFFIDPEILKDRDGRYISLITLSYTFYPVAPKPGLAEKSRSGAPAGTNVPVSEPQGAAASPHKG